MKTTKCLAAAFCALSFSALSQHNHHQTENYFTEKSLYDFEIEVGMSGNDFYNSAMISYVDKKYQQFHDSVQQLVDSESEIDSLALEFEYDSLILAVKNHKETMDTSVVIPTPKQLNGPCVNMDFENGDLSGWDLYRGEVDGSAPFSFSNQIPAAAGPYHQIMNGGNDPVTGIPTVGPLGGNFSVRLGNGTGAGAVAAKMRQTFLVDNTNYMFTYSYAVVFQSPDGHGQNQLPYFTVRVFDSLGGNVPCGEYTSIADAANSPDYLTTTWGGSTVLYKDWTTVFTNLSAYIGQNVTVEFTSGDCSLSGHFGYAYVDASCGMQDIIASQNTICTGDATTLTAPPGASAYQWSNGATTQSITVTSGGTYTCTLVPFQGGGCTISLDITITEYPEPVASFTSNVNTICESDPVVFTDQSTIPNPGQITGYQWDFGDGTATPTSTGGITGVQNTTGTYLNPTHTYVNNGTYTVSLTVSTADGCTDTYSSNIVVNALPVIVAGNDQTVCFGSPVTLNGSGAVSYQWDNGVMDGVAFVQAVGTSTYTVIGTDANGCQNSDQVNVIVNPLPVVDAGVNQAICIGDQVTLSGSGALNYAWDNGVFDGIAFTPQLGTLTYTVIGTDANGCQNTDNINVTVNPLPIISAGVDQTVCADQMVTLIGTGASTISWNQGVTNGVPFLAPVGSTVYTVTGTDQNGCVNTDQVTVNVNPLPNVVAGQDQVVCDGQQITLNGSGAVSYQWDNGVQDGVAFLQGVGTTTYTVIGTDINGCQNSDQVDVLVNPLPVVDAGQDLSVCIGDQVTLSGSGAVSYAWDFGVVDGMAFTPPLGTTTYSVIGTDLNGCQNTDNLDITVNPLPLISAGVDQTVCADQMVTLIGTGASTIVWDQGVSNGTPFLAPVGNTTYTVTGTDQNGCVNTDQVTVTVNPLPNVVGGPDQTVCDGEFVVLQAYGATTFSWSGGVTNAIPFIQPVGSNNYVVTGTDVNGCQNTDTVLVTVNPNPVVEAGENQSVCEGEMVILNGEGSANIYWNGGFQNGIPFSQSVGTVVYTLNDVYSTGCSSFDTVVVVVHPRPNVTAEDKVICEGDGVTLEGAGADSYTWNKGVIDGVEFYPIQSDFYTVIGTTIYGCIDSFTVKVDVNPLPIIDFKILDPSLTTVESMTGFDNLSSGAVYYSWDFGDGYYSNDFEPFHEFPTNEPGTYEVILTGETEFGCTAEKIKYVYVTQDYTIYVPNTFTPDANGMNEIFKPVMEGFDEDEFTLYIFNRWGDLIFESHNMQVGWDGSYAGQFDHVQDGVYTWKIEAGLENSTDTKVFVGHVTLMR